jgi:hypothetical protein
MLADCEVQFAGARQETEFLDDAAGCAYRYCGASDGGDGAFGRDVSAWFWGSEGWVAGGGGFT